MLVQPSRGRQGTCTRLIPTESKLCSCLISTQRLNVYDKNKIGLDAVPECISKYEHLNSFRAEEMGIKDIHALGLVKNLEFAFLANNKIQDISPLEPLVHLHLLGIAGNPLSIASRKVLDRMVTKNNHMNVF